MTKYVWILVEYMQDFGDKVISVFSSQAAAEHARSVLEECKETTCLSYWIEMKEVQ